MNADNLTAWLQRLIGELELHRHRALVVLAGDDAWCREAVIEQLTCLPANNQLWVGQVEYDQVTVVTAKQVHQILGREYDLAVFDAYEGFDADVFAAMTGTVRGGGICFLLIPPKNSWANFSDPVYQRLFGLEGEASLSNSVFIERFLRFIDEQAGVYCIEQHQTVLPSIVQTIPFGAEIKTPKDKYSQNDAISAVVNVVKGHRRRPAVLISDRGRGKSAAMGMAAAQLLKQGVKRIIVTAPRLGALASLFRHAEFELPECEHKQDRLVYQQSVIEFIPPDVILRNLPTADCLMIDEAAALPNPMLEQLLKHYSRLVFATTVHGYEGTGRGFALRFFKVLDQQTPGWKRLALDQPIRWNACDPLERFVFDALLLKSELASIEFEEEFDVQTFDIDVMTGVELAQHEARLNQVFALLVLAHYKTRPNDLRQLLDSPDITVFVSRRGDNVVGVVLVVDEGRIDKETQREVFWGRRRLRGHLLGQTLLTHLGLTSIENLRFARVMRIAVQPELQGKNIGTSLLAKVVEHCKTKEYDVLGSSFGVTSQLIPFWRKADFDIVRLGLTREHSSGCHSGVFLRSLNASAQDLFVDARRKFHQSWPYLLRDVLSELDSDIVVSLSVGDRSGDIEFCDEEWLEVEAFAYGFRGYEMAMPVLEKLSWQLLENDRVDYLTGNDQALLVCKVVQNTAWTELVTKMGYQGKSQALTALREVFQTIYLQFRSQ